MKKYRVSKELSRYVRRVLILFRARFKMVRDEEGQIWCHTNLSSNHFHRIVQRAKCVKKSDETGFLYMTFEESSHYAFKTYLMNDKNATTYRIIDDPTGERFWKREMGPFLDGPDGKGE